MVLINPERPRQVREYRNAQRFAAAVADRAARGEQPVQMEVVIQVRSKPVGEGWTDLVQFWAGPWAPEIPMPTKRDLIAAGRSVGARFVRATIRTKV